MRWRVMFGVSLVASLALAGCSSFLGDGGDDDSAGEDGTTGNETATASTSAGTSGTGDTGADFNEHCAAQADWDPGWAAVEAEVLELVNENRAAGATCGSETFGPAGPMVAEAQLRCAARLHSEDMAVRGFFDHTNPDGESPWDRVDKTDYSGNATGENIAAGYPDAAAVMTGWMDSPGHCSNIMNPNSTEIGIGYYGDGNYWTQVMGTR